jgi:nuclear transport factor 2 (NTF2) superfamily protein
MYPDASGAAQAADAEGQWWRSYGNEMGEFADDGLMRRREASINDVRISESDRRIFGSRPTEKQGIDIPLQ